MQAKAEISYVRNMEMVPTPNRPCSVVFVNRTELPLTAVSLKFTVANRLDPGGESSPSNCPSGETIEVQLARDETPYEAIEWTVVDYTFVAGSSYRIVVSGEPGDRHVAVKDEQIA